jgi:hypothetical protein
MQAQASTVAENCRRMCAARARVRLHREKHECKAAGAIVKTPRVHLYILEKGFESIYTYIWIKRSSGEIELWHTQQYEWGFVLSALRLATWAYRSRIALFRFHQHCDGHRPDARGSPMFWFDVIVMYCNALMFYAVMGAV